MKVIDFLQTVGRLKKIKRAGWVKNAKLKNTESVAEHVMRLSVLAMVLGKELGVDRDKLVRMALVHDLAESLTGDFILERGNKDISSRVDKHNDEYRAINKLFEGMQDKEEYLSLWKEYEKRQSKEAKILLQLDRLEMVLQAFDYEGQTDSSLLDEFWINAKRHIDNPKLKKILMEAESLRSAKIGKKND